MQGQLSQQSGELRGAALSGGPEEAPYVQGYQPTLGQGQGQREEAFRKSASFQDKTLGQPRQEAYRKSASFQDAVSPDDSSRAAEHSPAGLSRMPSTMAELQQDSGRIAAMRPAGYEAASGQRTLTDVEAVKVADPPARRTGSLLTRKQRAGSISVADRLKSVRGLLDTADENSIDDIQEDLPIAAMQQRDSFDTDNIDDAIAEEPQLAG